ncbi:5a4868c5-195a-4853-bc9c-91643dd03b7f [Thermothielavioides terrestris]|uniref:5a4868c5-195a-4853-bc9c-91643dd03b7f n=1 Tax=Thermothielavioides terrestris TaxID=2587410 RepID=A0A446BM25_9PEZI|nr:5a4868c5-195a-4853-bc9c-91643dd03b7f [Thermothielavioides terrestris]
MASSCILWQNSRKTVVLLDLPRSIEEAQLPSSQLTGANGQQPPSKLRRLISALPPAAPFPTPEPKTGGPNLPPTSASAQVAELMTQAAVESALEEIRQSHPLNGPLHALRPTLLTTSPPQGFDLIVLDPPWPNRSAKRKRKNRGGSGSGGSKNSDGSYRPAADAAAVRSLLRQVPVASRLAPGGLVAVWVTNAARFVEMLTGSRRGRGHSRNGDGGGGVGVGGLFAEWDVELVGEWVWLKVTTGGEPVVDVESRWRKPWERLLIARKRGGGGDDGSGCGGTGRGSVEGKVIVAVPDVHSRKPNLRPLFEDLLPERYEALEVFARNLTAGWWAWGDEVLLFQRRECWVEPGEADEDESNTGTAS